MGDNILNLLKKDHREVAKLLEKLAKTTEKTVEKRKILFDILKNSLSLHEKFEENVLFPSVKEKAAKTLKAKDRTLEIYEEHQIVVHCVVDGLMIDMERVAEGKEVWMAKLIVLKENIERHVYEEENKLFPKIKRIFKADELEKIGMALKDWKQNSQISLEI